MKSDRFEHDFEHEEALKEYPDHKDPFLAMPAVFEVGNLDIVAVSFGYRFTNERLMNIIQNDDEDKSLIAIGTLMQRYTPLINSTIRKTLLKYDALQENDEDQIDGLSSDCFSKIMGTWKKNRLQKVRAPVRWMETVAKTVTIDYLRCLSRERRNEGDLSDFLEVVGYEIDPINIESEVAVRALFNSVIEKLKPPLKEVAELYLLEKLDAKEIQEILDRPIGKVYKQIKVIKEKIKQHALDTQDE